MESMTPATTDQTAGPRTKGLAYEKIVLYELGSQPGQTWRLTELK